MSQVLQTQINFPDINSKIYKEYSKSIVESIKNLNLFTNNLQSKVATMLKAQQSEFVASYKAHMSNVKQQLTNMEQKMKDYQSKIQYYENQGRLSGYIKKVNFLQQEQNKLFLTLNEKEKIIKELKLQLHINENQKKALEEKLKSMYRQQIRNVEQQHLLKQNPNMESIHTFTTEVPNQRSKCAISKLSTQQYGLRSNRHLSDIQTSTLDKSQVLKLSKQLTNLKQQNRKLILFNTKFVTQNNELGQFFINSVNQIKKQIKIKKKINQVSFEDFKKQDKIALLIQLVSNEDVLLILYERLFKRSKTERAKSVLNRSFQSQTYKDQRNDQVMGSPSKQMIIVDPPIFPLIKQNKKTLQH